MSLYAISNRACLTPPVLSKICTANDGVRRGATESQVLQLAVALWCDDQEVHSFHELYYGRAHGSGRLLRSLIELQGNTAEQIAFEACIALSTARHVLDDILIPETDELLRLFVAAMIRDGRRAKVNALLGKAGYYLLLPPLPPLRHTA